MTPKLTLILGGQSFPNASPRLVWYFNNRRTLAQAMYDRYHA